MEHSCLSGKKRRNILVIDGLIEKVGEHDIDILDNIFPDLNIGFKATA